MIQDQDLRLPKNKCFKSHEKFCKKIKN